jgi:hypothetical protein
VIVPGVNLPGDGMFTGGEAGVSTFVCANVAVTTPSNTSGIQFLSTSPT